MPDAFGVKINGEVVDWMPAHHDLCNLEEITVEAVRDALIKALRTSDTIAFSVEIVAMDLTDPVPLVGGMYIDPDFQEG